MNRLIIIGNGFDLAHGLPTSYCHFIDDFWKNFKKKCKTDEYKGFIFTNELYDRYYSNYGIINNFIDLKSSINEYIKDYPEFYFNENSLTFFTSKYNGQEVIFEFRNEFFKLINIKKSQNWVDIENEYYYQLKKIVKSKCLDISKSNEYWSNEQRLQLIKLNNEFQEVKNLLEKYLKEKVVEKYDFLNYSDANGDFLKFHRIFSPELMSGREGQTSDYLDFFSKADKKEIVKLMGENKLDVRLHFLCFNYTPTLHRYVNHFNNNTKIDVEINHIHGYVGNTSDNEINFGFGDEMDDDYKIIESIDDNEYLKNFKSFKYLQNSNYKSLLNFVESGKFEVYIIGSSCGLSDRTLLNTIFENDNCRLIKIFFYKDEEYDNFTELTQNISRHFNKKALMRHKIVDKTLCKPLPQIQLPLI